MRPETVMDISVTLGTRSVGYPGDPPFRVEALSSLSEDGVALSVFSGSVHAGSHLDAPAHLVPGGKSIADYGPADFILPAMVIEAMGTDLVQPRDFAGADFGDCRAALFKTDNSARGLPVSGRYTADYAALSEGSAAELARMGMALVGIDYISIDAAGALDLPAHRRLLESGVLVLEGINLAGADPGAYTLICAPLKLDAEGAPVRALLVR